MNRTEDSRYSLSAARYRLPLAILSYPAFLLAARFVPFHRLPSTCLFLRVTGYPCPTCGMTRSTEALAHGNLAQAVRFNALGPVVVLLIGICWGCAVYALQTGRRSRLELWSRRHSKTLTALGLSVFLLAGVLRIWLMARG